MNSDVFGDIDKICRTLEELEVWVKKLKAEGVVIVLTSGSFDLLHVGHSRYLARAKKLGGCLIVGVDSDEKIKLRKGEGRPIVPHNERIEMLTYLSAVDIVYLKEVSDEKWAFIRTVMPNILIISKRNSYSKTELGELTEICGKVVVLESQAETSTSAKIRTLIINSTHKLVPLIAKVDESYENMRLALERLKSHVQEIRGESI